MVYKQSLLMTVGTILNSLLGLVFYVLLARTLGVLDFGKFSFYLGLGMLIAELTDLGVDASIVKFGAAGYFKKIILFAAKQRLASFTLLVLVFIVIAKLMDPFLIYSPAIAICTLLAFLTTQSLIAKENFFGQVVVNILGNTARIALLGVLLKLGLLTFVSGLVVFCLGAFITFIFGLGVFKNMNNLDNNLTTRDVFKFSIPAAGSFSLASLSSRLDIPILYGLAGPAAVGIYSSAQKLASVIPQVSAALDSVFAPKFSKDALGVLRQYLMISTLAVLGLIFGVFVSDFVMRIFGPDYTAASTVFKIILISYIPFFFAGPFAGKVLYGFGKSNYHLLTSTIALVASLICYFLLIPRFAEMGAAITVGIVNFVIWLVYLFTFYTLSRGS